jgi:Flp pilus assembly protein TadG
MRRLFRIGSQRGQATVEFVAALPAFLLACAIVWELLLAGASAWLASNAARAGARAAAVGDDARAAARRSLPALLRSGLTVTSDRDGRVRVRLAVPLVLPSFRGPLAVSASTRLGSPP